MKNFNLTLTITDGAAQAIVNADSDTPPDGTYYIGANVLDPGESGTNELSIHTPFLRLGGSSDAGTTINQD